MVIVIYVWMVLSWWFSRKSFSPIPPSFPLFVTDVAIVLVYAFVLVSFQNIGFVLMLLAVAFGLFILWDYLRARASERKYGQPRDLVTLIWAAIFFDIGVIYNSGLKLDVVFVTLSLGSSILYRAHKKFLWLVKDP